MLAFLRLMNLEGGARPTAVLCRAVDTRPSSCPRLPAGSQLHLIASPPAVAGQAGAGRAPCWAAPAQAVPDAVPVAGQDAFLMESLFRNEVWGHLQAPVSESNETAVFASMIDGCRRELWAG